MPSKAMADLTGKDYLHTVKTGLQAFLSDDYCIRKRPGSIRKIQVEVLVDQLVECKGGRHTWLLHILCLAPTSRVEACSDHPI